MLGKLFYYEMKQTSRLLVLMHGIGLILSLAVFALPYITGLGTGHIIVEIIQGLSMLLLVSLCFFTYFCFAARFYKTVFTNEGYLTNTLPVTAGQILLSRFFVALIWSVIDMVLFLVCLSLAGNFNIFGEFARHFPALAENPGFFLSMLALLGSGLLVTILSIFCAVAIGNLFGGHKMIGSIISFFFLNFVLQIASFIPLLFFLKDILTIPSGTYSLAQFKAAYPTIFHSIVGAFCAEAVLYLLFAVVLYWLTWYLMDKKLNLE